MLRGQLEAAYQQGQSRLQLARELGDPSLLRGSFTALGWVCHNFERPTKVQAALRENIARSRQLKQGTVEAINL